MPGDMSFSLVGHKALLRRFDKLPKALRIKVARAGVHEGGLILEREIRTQVNGPKLKVRSGRLRASVATELRGSGADIEARVGPHVPYARIHELGGTVRPKRSKHLTIPLRAALTPAGVPRFTARQIISTPALGGYTGTFSAKGVIFGKRGKQIVPLFALVDMVRVKAKHFMRDSLANQRNNILRAFLRHVRGALRKP